MNADKFLETIAAILEIKRTGYHEKPCPADLVFKKIVYEESLGEYLFIIKKTNHEEAEE